MLSEEERLRDALLEVEQSFEAERQRREELEALLEGLTSFTSATREALYDTLLPVLRHALRYQDAMLLVELGGGEWVARVATRDAFLNTRWRTGALFERVLGGQAVALFDVRQIEEWAEQPAGVLSGVSSALYIPLLTRGQRALLVGTHAERSFFSPRHVKLARRFSQMATQALEGLDARELWQQRRLADERAKLLERTVEALGVGIGMWQGAERLASASDALDALVAPWGNAEAWWQRVCERLRDLAPEIFSADPGAHAPLRLDVPLTLDGSGEPAVHQIVFTAQLHTVGDGAPAEIVLARDVSDLP